MIGLWYNGSLKKAVRRGTRWGENVLCMRITAKSLQEAKSGTKFVWRVIWGLHVVSQTLLINFTCSPVWIYGPFLQNKTWVWKKRSWFVVSLTVLETCTKMCLLLFEYSRWEKRLRTDHRFCSTLSEVCKLVNSILECFIIISWTSVLDIVCQTQDVTFGTFFVDSALATHIIMWFTSNQSFSTLILTDWLRY